MSEGLRIVLLLFALIGYGGVGASLAVTRYRRMSEGERDVGMIAVAVMLFVFGALCTMVAAGLTGVLAFGGVTIWVAYVLMAQHLGMFRIETGRRHHAEEEPTEETRRAK